MQFCISYDCFSRPLTITSASVQEVQSAGSKAFVPASEALAETDGPCRALKFRTFDEQLSDGKRGYQGPVTL
jgi:hypothetical protein